MQTEVQIDTISLLWWAPLGMKHVKKQDSKVL